VETRADFVIFRHAKETERTSNTARLAALILRRCTIRPFGQAHVPLDDTGLRGPHTYLLFPDGPPGPVPPGVERVVVLDGSWSQAKHMLQRIPALRPLPRISLPPPREPRRRLRRPPSAEGMSTLEAMAHLVALLEGPDQAAPLFTLHDEMVERVLWTRGLSGVSPGSP
jgi:DTW domain-containing protein YfiP